MENIPLAITFKEILSKYECDELIKYINLNNPSKADIKGIGFDKSIRNNLRVIKNDFYIAEKIAKKICEFLPKNIGDYSIVGCNELIRFYKYQEDMCFKPHKDDCFKRNEFEKSFYTVLVYLNDVDLGGETVLITEPTLTIKPNLGYSLVFKHDILHEAKMVKNGFKYILRTDVMYSKYFKR